MGSFQKWLENKAILSWEDTVVRVKKQKNSEKKPTLQMKPATGGNNKKNNNKDKNDCKCECVPCSKFKKCKDCSCKNCKCEGCGCNNKNKNNYNKNNDKFYNKNNKNKDKNK